MRLKAEKSLNFSRAPLSGPSCNCTFGTKTHSSRSIRGAQRAQARKKEMWVNKMKKGRERAVKTKRKVMLMSD